METRSFTKLALKKQKTKSMESLNQTFTSTSSEIFARSLPDLSTEHNMYISELQEEINTLKQQLEIAHTKVEELTCETISLKKERDEQKTEIINLKEICSRKESENYQPRRLFSQNLRSETEIVDKTKQHDCSQKQTTSKEFSNAIIDGVALNETLEQQDLTQKWTSSKKYKNTTTEGAINQNTRNDNNLIYSAETANNTFKSTQTAQKNNENRIFIIGEQQCIGLAQNLISSRNKSINGQYKIFSFIKPFAKCSESLKACYSLDLKENDWIIICVGQNDQNPNQIQFELLKVLNYLRNNNVIVLSINKHLHLNETKLNTLLKFTCHSFYNCNFLDLTNLYEYYYKYRYFQNHTCRIINSTIDAHHHYKTEYTSPGRNNETPHGLCQNGKISTPKKGTIPYYFRNTNQIKFTTLAKTNKDSFLFQN